MGICSSRVHLTLLAAVWVACTPPTEAPHPPPSPPLTGAGPFIVSNPVAGGATGVLAGGASEAGLVTWVSLPPGALAWGTSVRIRVDRTGAEVSVPLVEGGHDPVAVPATSNDTLTILVETSGVLVTTFRVRVPARKPPVIVRTRPEKNKRDVPLNASIQVVFSEPIDPASVTPGNIELRAGGTLVAGQLGFTNPAHTGVEFTPMAELAGATEYVLVLRTGIRDSEGTPLEIPESITFTTVPPAPPGELVVTIATTGADLGPGSFHVRVDGGAVLPIDPLGTVRVPGLSPGPHWVTLSDLGVKCRSIGTNPRQATVPAGGTATVVFDVGCSEQAAVGRLAFVRDGEIHTINSDGTSLVKISSLAGSRETSRVWATTLAWSPDGRRIAFGIQDDSQWWPAAINVMNADGSNVIRVTDGGPEIWAAEHPAWSPDGQTLLYTSYHDGGDNIGPGGWGLFTVPSGGGAERTPLFWPKSVSLLLPAWSPDGRQITFSSHAFFGDHSDLYIMNADGTGSRPLLVALSGAHYYGSAWSPDGLRLSAVSCRTGEVRCELLLINADGSGRQMLAETIGYGPPSWSPDGSMIAFTSVDCNGCPRSVRFVRVDGSGGGLIVSNGDYPAWRP